MYRSIKKTFYICFHDTVNYVVYLVRTQIPKEKKNRAFAERSYCLSLHINDPIDEFKVVYVTADTLQLVLVGGLCNEVIIPVTDAIHPRMRTHLLWLLHTVNVVFYSLHISWCIVVSSWRFNGTLDLEYGFVHKTTHPSQVYLSSQFVFHLYYNSPPPSAIHFVVSGH